MDHKAVENAWAKMPFASSLSSKVNTAMVDTLSAVGNPVSVKIGKPIIAQDDKHIDRGFIIVSGSFSVLKNGAPSMIKEAPELIGEMSHINPRHERTAEVRSESDVVAIFFDWKELFSGLEERLSEEEVGQLTDALKQHAWDHFTES